MPDNFQVAKSQSGYRVELHRHGKPYATFVDGLSKEAAEREARSLGVLWQRIRARIPRPRTRAANSDED